MADKISEKVIVTSICKPSLKVSSFMARYFLEFGGKCNTTAEGRNDGAVLACGRHGVTSADWPTDRPKPIAESVSPGPSPSPGARGPRRPHGGSWKRGSGSQGAAAAEAVLLGTAGEGCTDCGESFVSQKLLSTYLYYWNKEKTLNWDQGCARDMKFGSAIQIQDTYRFCI